jgi:riboflavin synthase
MFTGIVAGTYPVLSVVPFNGTIKFTVQLDESLVLGLEIGASVAVDGVCLTVTGVEGSVVSFDVVAETCVRSTLRALHVGRLVNIERAARFGDEIGGHILSGHVIGTGEIVHQEMDGDNRVVTFACPPQWMKYILTKGYIAIDGASLTVVDTYFSGSFTVTLIPETIRNTIFKSKGIGGEVNIEVDPQTQLIVETVERLMLPKEAEVT